MFGKKIRTIIKIEGMSCCHCANKVEKTLKGIPNVKSVKVNLTKKEAVIVSCKSIEQILIKEIIENLDYKIIDIVEE